MIRLTGLILLAATSWGLQPEVVRHSGETMAATFKIAQSQPTPAPAQGRPVMTESFSAKEAQKIYDSLAVSGLPKGGELYGSWAKRPLQGEILDWPKKFVFKQYQSHEGVAMVRMEIGAAAGEWAFVQLKNQHANRNKAALFTYGSRTYLCRLDRPDHLVCKVGVFSETQGIIYEVYQRESKR